MRREEGAGALQPFGGCYHEALQIGCNCFHKALVYQISAGMIASMGAVGQMLRLGILWDDCGFCNSSVLGKMRAKERMGPLENEVVK